MGCSGPMGIQTLLPSSSGELHDDNQKQSQSKLDILVTGQERKRGSYFSYFFSDLTTRRKF